MTRTSLGIEPPIGPERFRLRRALAASCSQIRGQFCTEAPVGTSTPLLRRDCDAWAACQRYVCTHMRVLTQLLTRVYL